jgi:hypothetical protein
MATLSRHLWLNGMQRRRLGMRHSAGFNLSSSENFCGEAYLPQQQHPPQSSPRQQHFSQQQAVPQCGQQSAAFIGAGLAMRKGNRVRAMDLKVMARA